MNLSKLTRGNQIIIPNAPKKARIKSFNRDGTIDKVVYDGREVDYIELVYKYRKEIKGIIGWIISLFKRK